MTKDDNMFRRAQRFVRDNARSAGNKLDESAVIKNIVKKVRMLRNYIRNPE